MTYGLFIEISVVIIALAFCILVFYLVTTLKAANRSLNQLQDTVTKLEKQVESLSQESVKLVQNANDITEDVQSKMRSLDKLFTSAAQVGETVHEVTSSVKQVSASVTNTLNTKVNRTLKTNEQPVSELMQWVSLTMGLVQRVKDWRNAGQGSEKS